MTKLYAPTGGEWEPSSPAEEIRLLRAGYSRNRPPFDPKRHTVEEVLAHLKANPAETDAVVAAERLGQARKSITGDQE